MWVVWCTRCGMLHFNADCHAEDFRRAVLTLFHRRAVRSTHLLVVGSAMSRRAAFRRRPNAQRLEHVSPHVRFGRLQGAVRHWAGTGGTCIRLARPSRARARARPGQARPGQGKERQGWASKASCGVNGALLPSECLRCFALLCVAWFTCVPFMTRSWSRNLFTTLHDHPFIAAMAAARVAAARPERTGQPPPQASHP